MAGEEIFSCETHQEHNLTRQQNAVGKILINQVPQHRCHPDKIGHTAVNTATSNLEAETEYIRTNYSDKST
jgi:hypothetical protein